MKAYTHRALRSLQRVAAAAIAQFDRADVTFAAGVALVALGVHGIYPPAAPTVAGALLIWASLPTKAPAPPTGKK
jgi:hypothetical protein